MNLYNAVKSSPVHRAYRVVTWPWMTYYQHYIEDFAGGRVLTAIKKNPNLSQTKDFWAEGRFTGGAAKKQTDWIPWIPEKDEV